MPARIWALSTIFVFVSLAAAQQPAEEIPLGRCDGLPVVQVRAAGRDMRFLVDTAATSILNLKSFAETNSKEIRITSWNGTNATTASEITLAELVLGRYRVRNLKLPAVDLRALSEASGCEIDGILGADLLEQMGATIDMKRRVALLPGPSSASDPPGLAQLRLSIEACLEAFNRSDARTLEGCISPGIVLFTTSGEFKGREAFLDYLGRRYFSASPAGRFELRARDFRLLADAAWFGYDYTILLPGSVQQGRGMAMARKADGRWNLVHMHNSEESSHPAAAAK